MRRLIQLFPVFLLIVFMAYPAFAAGLEVTNISVATQAEDGVKARDLALARAQRLAFGALAGKSEVETASVSDLQIARLVKGFSVQGERLTSRAYRAFFTIRFLQAPTNNLVQSNGWQLVDQAAQGQPVVFDNTTVAVANVAATAAATGGAPQGDAAKPNTVPAAPAIQSIVILPVLDIGSRRVVWDDPNPWREVWQKSSHEIPNMNVSLPLGDVEDVTDIPDQNFLNGGQANVVHFLERYKASKLYVVVAKNMGAVLNTESGMSLSLYSHDGKQLKFIRKMLVHPRPGYLFDDAVPVALQMITQIKGDGSTTINHDVLEGKQQPSQAEPEKHADQPQQPETFAASAGQAIVNNTVTIVVPYQSLQQWVSIQKRLRTVPGIKAVIPVRVSATGAEVKIMTTTTNTDDLSRNLSIQHFILQKMSSGEMVLIEQ